MNNKGIALYLVLGTLLVVVLLASIVLNLMLSQSRLGHHQISRIRAYYAGQAALNYVREELRLGNWVAPAANAAGNFYACLNGCVENVAATYTIPNDSGILYRAQVTIHPPVNNTSQLDAIINYTD